MIKAGTKRPLKVCLGENSNSNELRHKRSRFDNIVLLRDGGGNQNGEELIERRYYEDHELGSNNSFQSQRRILRAGGKRKQPVTEDVEQSIKTLDKHENKASDENDIINELTKEFKKARLRPVFFTISSFVEQTVDEVGFTLADEPDAEITVRLTLPKKEYDAEPCTPKETLVEKEIVLTSKGQIPVDANQRELIYEKNTEFELQDDIQKTSPVSLKCSSTHATDFVNFDVTSE